MLACFMVGIVTMCGPQSHGILCSRRASGRHLNGSLYKTYYRHYIKHQLYFTLICTTLYNSYLGNSAASLFEES